MPADDAGRTHVRSTPVSFRNRVAMHIDIATQAQLAKHELYAEMRRVRHGYSCRFGGQKF